MFCPNCGANNKFIKIKGINLSDFLKMVPVICKKCDYHFEIDRKCLLMNDSSFVCKFCSLSCMIPITYKHHPNSFDYILYCVACGKINKINVINQTPGSAMINLGFHLVLHQIKRVDDNPAILDLGKKFPGKFTGEENELS